MRVTLAAAALAAAHVATVDGPAPARALAAVVAAATVVAVVAWLGRLSEVPRR